MIIVIEYLKRLRYRTNLCKNCIKRKRIKTDAEVCIRTCNKLLLFTRTTCQGDTKKKEDSFQIILFEMDFNLLKNFTIVIHIKLTGVRSLRTPYQQAIGSIKFGKSLLPTAFLLLFFY